MVDGFVKCAAAGLKSCCNEEKCMDMEQLGYFLYMEQCDRKEKERQEIELLKLNADFIGHLVAEQSTQSENKK